MPLDDDRSRRRRKIDFFHAPSAAKGSYVVSGRLDRRSGKVLLRPEGWVVRPDGYVMVGMAGIVSEGGERMSGRITNAACGDFDVRLQARE